MVIDSQAGEAVVFGGRNAQETFGDLWYYDLEESAWVPVSFPEDNWPAARAHHAIVYDQAYGAAVVIGGSAHDYPCDEATVAVYVTDFEWYGHVTDAGPGIGSTPFPPSCLVWPVPSAGLTRIEFDLSGPERVVGAIFDASGARVRTLTEAILPAGTHRLEWDGRAEDGSRVAAGVYFYRIRIGGRDVRGKIVTVE
jgi:hypothetical protein